MKILGSLLLIPLLTGCTNYVDLPPGAVSDPLSTPSLATGSDLPISQPSRVPSPTKKHNPPSISTTIFVVANVSPKWRLQETIKGWSPAKYTNFMMVNRCPRQWNIPCVTIKESKTVDKDTAGETVFSTWPSKMVIDLNTSIYLSKAESEVTLCHEFGHILGAYHIKGRKDTCMFIGSYRGRYPKTATTLDLQMVDRLGSWDVEKMYDSSGKTVVLASNAS